MRTSAGDYLNWTKQVCKHELGQEKKLHTAIFFSFDGDSFALEAGTLKGGCVSTEAQWISDIINRNFDKVKNEKSVQQFQDLTRPFPPCYDCLAESPQNSSC